MIPYCILVIDDDNDREFMTQLYLDYNQLMRSEVQKIIKNEYDAEDVLQNVLEKLIDKIPLLRSRNRDQLVNYIISACKYTSFNYLRDNKYKRVVALDDYLSLPDETQDTHEIELRLIKDEELEALHRVLSKMDLQTQCLLEGYYILDKPMAELAVDLGIKPDSIRMTLTRTRKKAFKLLQEEVTGGAS